MSDHKPSTFLLRLVLLIAVPAVVVGIGFFFWLTGGRYISTDNAYVKADIVQISADVVGRVVEVGVADHTVVQEGDLLFRLDPAPFQIAVARAEAEVARARNDIETMRAEYMEAKAAIGEDEVQIAFFKRQVERQEHLLKRGVTGRDHLDRATSALQMAKEKRAAARQKMQRMLTALGGTPDADVTEHPLFLEKLAELRQAQLDLDRALVRAPTAGIVTNMKLQPGEYVEDGEPVFSLVAAGAAWVEANLKETNLTNIRVGQKATVVVDAYPDQVFEAEIASISPATGAEFAVLPPQNATGNWVKVVQRLPVKLRLLKHMPEDAPLRAGMTVTVEIDTEFQRPALTALQKAFDGSAHAAD